MEKNNSKSIFLILLIGISVLGAISLAITALSSVYFAKLLRFLGAAQRALPTFKKAAQFYVDKNTMAEYCSAGDE